MNQGVLNSYCWMYSNFNIPPSFKGSCAKREHDGNTLYNTYYQWVAIFLVIQVWLTVLFLHITLMVKALIFYLPRVLWLSMEGGLMKFLVRNARGKIVEDAEEKRDSLIKTFQVKIRSHFLKLR